MLSSDAKAKKDKINKKLQNKIRQMEKDLDSWRKKALTPLDYLKAAADADGNLLYSQFDDKGIPSHDATGQPLSKKQIKKAKKAYDKQEKAYKQYQAKVQKNPTLIQDLEKELNETKAQLL